MAKAKANLPRKQRVQGPFLDAAFICEQLIVEQGNAYSAIRMVNRITFHEQRFDSGTLLLMPLVLVISFKAGDVRDTRHLSLYVTAPSGSRAELEGIEASCPITFIGGDTGAFMALRNFPIKYEEDGTYWIDVILDRKRYSRLPLTIVTEQA